FKGQNAMPMVAYKVAPNGQKWLVTRDGEPGMSYVSQEAAYEVAVSEAAGDLRTGHEIRIEVLGSAYTRLGDGSAVPTDEGLARA
ncbi:MAG TPA: hypothetical protein VLI91_09615, partial [Roseiarcus sp.]|nr:hypothetical protein [Roseiarcus sp.]